MEKKSSKNQRTSIWLLTLSCLFVLVLFGCDNHRTQDPLTPRERAWLSEHNGTIRLAHDPDARPIDYLDEHGNFKGLAADYARLIEEHLNFKFNILKIPTWNEVLTKAKSKEIDVLCAFTKTDERERWMLFTDPYLTIDIVILTRNEYRGRLSLDTMKNTTVTFTKGWVVEDYLKKNYSHLNLLPAIDEDAAMNNLLTERADAWITAISVASVKIEDNRVSNIRIAGDTDLSFKLAFASRKDWPVLNDILKKGLAQIPEKERTDIFKKWIRLDQGSIFANRTLWIVLGVVTGVFALFIVTIYSWNETLKQKVAAKTEALNKELLERKLTEEALRESERKFRNIFDHSSDAIFIHDMGGNFLEVNQVACRRLGYTQKQLLKMTPADVNDPESARKIPEWIQELKRSRQLVFEAVHRHRDGTPIPVEINSRFIDYSGKTCILSVVRDITDRKQAERERGKLQNQLHQAQKMESIGNLAGGIAHDFNNILSSIIGFTELALEEVPKGTRLEDNLQEVYSAAKRAKNLVSQILAFARQSEEADKPVQVSAIVKEVLSFIRSTIPTSIQMNVEIDSMSVIWGNPTQIHQMLMNLCTNAAQSMDASGGTLGVALKDVAIDAGCHAYKEGMKPGAYIEINISDTGKGIAPDIIDHIFEPYFTTKSPGEGTGMGLAVVQGIVEKSQGNIVVDSHQGEGTVFRVYLPVTNEPRGGLEYDPQSLPGGTERILFVDDEASIARMAGQLLAGMGYAVTTKTSSVDALELFRSKPDSFDLVITDMTMPNMTGDTLATEMMAERPDIPVILCTGFSKKVWAESAAHIGIKAFIYKPVVRSDLAKTVRRVLDEAMDDTGK